MDPGPDRLRLLITGLRLVGNRRRHLQKLVGFAVAAGQQIRQGILGQVQDERETGIGIDGDLLRRFHGAGAGDGRAPRGKDGALGDVSERVFKVPKRDIRS